MDGLAVELGMSMVDIALRDAHNLIEIHRRSRSPRGVPTREASLNRAVVVLAVAAWQSFVESEARSALRRCEPSGTTPRQDFYVLRASVTNAIRNFSTPNAENTRDLLLRVGVDPWPHWTWPARPQTITPPRARARLNQWIAVRNSIAHGDLTLPDVDVLTRTTHGRSVRLADVERLLDFIRRLARATIIARHQAFRPGGT